MSELLDQEIRTLQSIYWSERDPDGFAFASLADAFRRRGNVREALDLLTDGTSRHPDFATGHVVTARLYLEQGMHAEAEFAARRVLDLDPGNIIGLATLTTALHAQGAVDEAGAFRSTLAGLDPESEEARSVATLELPEVAADDGLARPLDELSLAAPEVSEAEGEAVSSGFDVDGSLLDALSLASPAAEDEAVEDDDQLAEALEALGLDEDGGAGDGGASTDLELLMPESEPEPGTLVEDVWAPEASEDAVFDLGEFAPETSASTEEDVLDLSGLAPEPVVEPQEEILDLGALAPESVVEPEEEIFDLGALAPEPVVEPEEEIFDLGALAPEPVVDPEEEIFDLGALAPEPAAEPEEAIFDLGALAPEPAAEPEEEIFDLGALAPESVVEPEEEIFDLGALAPEPAAEPEEEIFDVGALAPEPVVEPEEEIFDLGALAPEPEPEFASLDDLAPSPPGSGTDRGPATPFVAVADLDALAPDPELEFASLDDLGPADAATPSMAEEPVSDEAELVMDFGALAPEGAQEEEENVDEAQPIYTRTLAELYVKQGFTDQAIAVFRHLLEVNPGADDLRRRIAELEGGAGAVPPARPVAPERKAFGADADDFAVIEPAGVSGQVGATGHGDEEVEKLARDLSESGAHLHDVDTPFAWSEESTASEHDDDDPESISSWFDRLLEWGEREEP